MDIRTKYIICPYESSKLAINTEKPLDRTIEGIEETIVYLDTLDKWIKLWIKYSGYSYLDKLYLTNFEYNNNKNLQLKMTKKYF